MVPCYASFCGQVVCDILLFLMQVWYFDSKSIRLKKKCSAEFLCECHLCNKVIPML